jgi:3-oxoacyl-[acyl-carrier protein] reductase
VIEGFQRRNRMRHALITAGSKGLGKRVMEEFLRKDYTVTVTYRSDDEAMAKLRDTYENEYTQFIQADVTKKEDLYRIVDETMKKFGRIDCLINNAGPYIFERKKMAEYTEEEWETLINGNLSAVFYLLKRVIPIMREQRFGRIVNYGFQGADSAAGWIYRSAFAAAKVGLVSLTKTIAYEEAEYGITSNMVCPGDIAGGMKEASIVAARIQSDFRTPIGRSGTGEDIARAVLFFCDENADMITGTCLEVTGGMDVIHRHR